MIRQANHIIQNTFLGLICVAMGMIGFSAGVLISDSVNNSTLERAEALNKDTNYTGETSTQMLVPWTQDMKYDLEEVPLQKT